jgi:hypothetical protein
MKKTESGGRYGIRIRDYCAEHEAYIQRCLDDGEASGALLQVHRLKIRWLQHERLVHLIVLFIVCVLFLFSVWLFIALGNPFVLILVAAALALLGAYLRHYFFLENKVQYWYALHDRLCEKMRQ